MINKGFIHDLTSNNLSRKYPIDHRMDNQEYNDGTYDMMNENMNQDSQNDNYVLQKHAKNNY